MSSSRSIWQFLSGFAPPFLLVWMTTFTLASVFHSQYIVNELIAVGVDIQLKDRLSLTIDDWVGLLPTYGIIIAIGLLIAFLVAGGLLSKFNPKRNSSAALIWGIAGGAAIVSILMAMQPILDITLIAGARGLGFYMQIIAGCFGGLLFFALIKKQN